MSTTRNKFLLRILLAEDGNIQEAIKVLSHSEINFEVEDTDYLYDAIKITEEGFDIFIGIDTNNIYVDHLVDSDEFYLDGSISVKQVNKIASKFPSGVESKAVAYGYYTGTDEPEIF